MTTRITVVVALFGLVLLVVQSEAEQITSACRVTAIDAANRTVTLVRKTASGEKSGVAKVAENANIEIRGKPVALESLTTPVDASVVYDTELRAVVGIMVVGELFAGKASTAMANDHAAVAESSPAWTFIDWSDKGQAEPDAAYIVTKEGTLICTQRQKQGYLISKRVFPAMTFSIEFRYPDSEKPDSKGGAIVVGSPGPSDLKSVDWTKRIPFGFEVKLSPSKCGQMELPNIDYEVELPLGQIRDGRRVTRTRQKDPVVGQWNRLDVECSKFNTVTVRLNGEVVNAVAGARDVTGRIALWPMSSEIHFRNPTVAINGKAERLEFNVSVPKGTQ